MGKRKKNKRKRRNKGRGGGGGDDKQQQAATATAQSEDASSSSGPAAEASESAQAPESQDAKSEPKKAESKKAESKKAEPKSEAKQSGRHPYEDDGPRGLKGKIQTQWFAWAYKSKRGTLVRWCSVGIFYFLVAFGLHNMYYQFGTWAGSQDSIIYWWNTELALVPLPLWDEAQIIDVGLVITTALALGGLAFLLWLFWKKPEVSEFMIDTETEMYKVSWPPWEELKSSTIATVIATVLLGLYLFFVDMVLSSIFEMIIRIDS